MLEEKYNKINSNEGQTFENREQSATQDAKSYDQQPSESLHHSDTSKQNVDDLHVKKNEMNLKHDGIPHLETNTEQTTNTQHMHVKKSSEGNGKSESQNSHARDETNRISQTMQAHIGQRDVGNLGLPPTEESEKQPTSEGQKQPKEGTELKQKIPEENLQHQKEKFVNDHPEKQNTNERDEQPKTETDLGQNVRNQPINHENPTEKVIDLHEDKAVHQQGPINSRLSEARNSNGLPLQEEINPPQEQTSHNKEKGTNANQQQIPATPPKPEVQSVTTQGEPLARQSSQSEPAVQQSSQSEPAAKQSSQNIKIPKDHPIPTQSDAQTKNQQQHQDMEGQPVLQTNNLHQNQPAPSQPEVQNVNRLNVHQTEKPNVQMQQESWIGFGTEARQEDVPGHNTGQYTPLQTSKQKPVPRNSGDSGNQGESSQQQKQTTPQGHFSESQDQVNPGRLQMNGQQVHQSSAHDQMKLHMQASENQHTGTFQQGSSSFSGNGQFPNSGYTGDQNMFGVDPRFADMYPPHMQGHVGHHQFPAVPNFANGFGANQYHDPRFASYPQMHQHPHQFMNPDMSQFGHQFSNVQQMSTFEHPGSPPQAVRSVEKQVDSSNPAHINPNQKQGS